LPLFTLWKFTLDEVAARRGQMITSHPKIHNQNHHHEDIGQVSASKR